MTLGTEGPLDYLVQFRDVLNEFGRIGGFYFELVGVLQPYAKANRSVLENIVKRSLIGRSGLPERRDEYQTLAQDENFLKEAVLIADDLLLPKSITDELAFEAASNYDRLVGEGRPLDDAGTEAREPLIRMFESMKNGRYMPVPEFNTHVDTFVERYKEAHQRGASGQKTANATGTGKTS